MYETGDIITAVSSGAAEGMRHIIRLSGTDAAAALTFFSSRIDASRRHLVRGSVRTGSFDFEATAYVFPARKSYTGDELIELHIECPLCIAEKFIETLCRKEGVRLAEPGEFTARAYFNGKLDLAQAEAVAQIVSGSNSFQLQAAQKLLKGKLSQRIADLRSQILELLSLLEAGMDFSEEDITFITESQAMQRAERITAGLGELISNNIKYERMIALPAVAIAGCPNAGKSSLMNALLKRERCIVSAARATTRDVISEVLEFENCSCVLTDCAGIVKNDSIDEIDAMAQNAAFEAVRGADITIFCVDVCRDDFSREMELLECINKKVIALATKSDKLAPDELARKLSMLEDIFKIPFIPLCTSVKEDINSLLAILEKETALANAGGKNSEEVIAVNRRHYEALERSLEGVKEGLEEIRGGSDELAAMHLRGSYHELCELDEQQSIDESILDKIFSNFCIGK